MPLENTLCRLCGHPNEILRTIWTKISGETTLVDLIEKYLAMTVEADSRLPTAVCCECTSQMTNFHHFASRVWKVQDYIQTIVIENSTIDASLGIKEELLEFSIESELNTEFDATTNTGVNINTILPSLEDMNQKSDPIKSECEGEKEPEDTKFYNNMVQNSEPLVEKQYNKEEISQGSMGAVSPMDSSSSDDEVLANYKLKKLISNSQFSSEKRTFHLNNVANDPTTFICILCERKGFKCFEKLLDHYQIHRDSTGKRWQCTQCDKTFMSKSYLNKHLNVNHRKIRKFICEICGKRFYDYRGLKTHLQSHNDSTHYKCLRCGKRFQTKLQLTRHKLTHVIRSLPCSVCRKKYTSARNLQRHEKLHDKKSHHKCSICSKLFLEKSKLQNHINVHTGQKPYQCMWCPKSFADGSNRIIHSKRLHKNEYNKYKEDKKPTLSSAAEYSDSSSD